MTLSGIVTRNLRRYVKDETFDCDVIIGHLLLMDSYC